MVGLIVSQPLAQSAATLVFQNLSQHGFDGFIDFDGLASGDFEHAQPASTCKDRSRPWAATTP